MRSSCFPKIPPLNLSSAICRGRRRDRKPRHRIRIEGGESEIRNRGVSPGTRKQEIHQGQSYRISPEHRDQMHDTIHGAGIGLENDHGSVHSVLRGALFLPFLPGIQPGDKRPVAHAETRSPPLGGLHGILLLLHLLLRAGDNLERLLPLPPSPRATAFVHQSLFERLEW